MADVTFLRRPGEVGFDHVRRSGRIEVPRTPKREPRHIDEAFKNAMIFAAGAVFSALLLGVWH